MKTWKPLSPKAIKVAFIPSNSCTCGSRHLIGLWVLVLKTGELRAELGYLCLCCENGGPDVAVWEGIGDLTDKTYVKFRVANENGNGFIIRPTENGQCSASSSSAS